MVFMERRHRASTRPCWSMAFPKRKVVKRASKQSDCMTDPISELIHALRLIAVVPHRPTQGLYPVLHDLWCPLYTVELGAVSEHGNDVFRVFFAITDELEGNAPEHGHADQSEARG